MDKRCNDRRLGWGDLLKPGACLAVIVLWGLPPSWGQPDDLELSVSPSAGLVDEQFTVLVRNVEAGQSFRVRAVTLDQRERAWIAEAEFTPRRDGIADLGELAPDPGGTYRGADAMGLFWSARPPAEGAQIAHAADFVFPTQLQLLSDGEVVDTATVVRTFSRGGVEVVPVNEPHLVGAYHRPLGTGPFPAVVVFAGSDGGLTSADWRAALLAARGIAALAVAVFSYDGRPDDLVEIPLEYAVGAVDWLQARPESGRLGAVGFSKGSELALSLGARDDRLEAIVAISPSAYVWPGISDGPPESRSSWTWQGQPIANVPWSVGPKAGAMFGAGPPFRLRVLYEESLAAASPETLRAARIPVTDVAGEILLVSGDADGSWPASPMARTITETMGEAGRSADVTHLDYPEAGHLIFWDFLPATAAAQNRGQVFGGEPAATMAARADSWQRIQGFLLSTLGSQGSIELIGSRAR